MATIQERPLDELMQMMGQAQPGSIMHNEASAEYYRRQFKNAQRATTVAIISASASLVSALAAWTAVFMHK